MDTYETFIGLDSDDRINRFNDCVSTIVEHYIANNTSAYEEK